MNKSRFSIRERLLVALVLDVLIVAGAFALYFYAGVEDAQFLFVAAGFFIVVLNTLLLAFGAKVLDFMADMFITFFH